MNVDEKGRLVLPRRIRREARIGPKARLVVRAEGVGRVELSDPAVLAARAREIGAEKLSGWDEEDHESTAHILGSVKAKDEDR